MAGHSIETQRLQLRELEVADCSDAYVAWMNDPEVKRFLETRFQPEQTIDSIRGFVASIRAKPNEVLFGIFLKEAGRHIGNIKVGPISAIHLCGDVSLLVGARDCWGAGYAAEAIGAVSRYAFSSLGVHKLSASMYSPNVGSTKAFLKTGYRQEGLRRDHYMLDGERCDIVELGLLRSDLP